MEQYFRALRQGQVLDLSEILEFSGLYVIVSQSCDVVQPKRETLQLAPLTQLTDPEIFRGAAKKANPRFPLVSAVDGTFFADLARIVSVEKAVLFNAPVSHAHGIDDSRKARDFGLAVARWFGRFAFPDEVQPWIAPVQHLIRSKYDSPESFLGRVLQHVAEVRVEATSWDALPVSLTLHVIVKAGQVPTVPEDADLSEFAHLPTDLSEICAALLNEAAPVRRAMLWAAFADSLASRCKPRTKEAQDPAIRDAVTSVTGELSSDDEFPLSRIRRSEQLDVDFLSDPAPY